MGYLDNAIATTRGWVSPKGELLKAQKMSKVEVDAHNGVKSTPAPKTAPKVDISAVMEEAEMENNTQQLNEAPMNNTSLDEMSKVELEALGRQHGVEFDRREKQSTLVGKMKNLLG